MFLVNLLDLSKKSQSKNLVQFSQYQYIVSEKNVTKTWFYFTKNSFYMNISANSKTVMQLVLFVQFQLLLSNVLFWKEFLYCKSYCVCSL